MKRFEIKDISSGQITHGYEAESEMSHQPGWGTLEHQEQVLNEDGTPLLDADGLPVLYTVPATYEVIVTDITAERALAECRSKRAAKYPPEGDFADAFVKLQAGNPKPMADYVAACLAVKAEFPKPAGL